MIVSQCALYHDILKDDYHRTHVPPHSMKHYFSSRSAAIKEISHSETTHHPPLKVANYIRKQLPAIPITGEAKRRKPLVGQNTSSVYVKMTFGVLSTGPKRFTLTDMKGTFVGPDNPIHKMVQLTAEDTPIQSPQPQQPSNKFNQITGYPLNNDFDKATPHNRRIPPNKVQQLTGYDLSSHSPSSYLNSADRPESSVDGSDMDSKSRTSSVYSQNQQAEDMVEDGSMQSPGSFARDVSSSWHSWQPTVLEDTKRISETSNVSEDSIPYSDRSFVPTALHVAPLNLKSRDRPQTPQRGGLLSGLAEPYPTRDLRFDEELELVSDDVISTDFNPRALIASITVSARNDSQWPHSPTIGSFHCPDPSQFALNPRLAPEIPRAARPHIDSSRFSDSDESDNEVGYFIAKGKDVVVHGLRNIPSHVNFTNPAFRKVNKPASIRTVSSTASGHQRLSLLAKKSPFLFKGKRSHEDLSADATLKESDDSSHIETEETRRFRRRFSSAFRNFSKTSTGISDTCAPTSAPCSPSTKTSISSSTSTLPKERIIYTTTRKPGTPDTPARPSFRKTYSLGSGGTRVKDIMKGKKGEVEQKQDEEKIEERRKKILNSIRVVRFGENDKAVEVFGKEPGMTDVGGTLKDTKATTWL